MSQLKKAMTKVALKLFNFVNNLLIGLSMCDSISRSLLNRKF